MRNQIMVIFDFVLTSSGLKFVEPIVDSVLIKIVIGYIV